MPADQVGQADIRGLNIDKAVTGFALASYVFLDRLCSVQSSSSWQERYYEESASDLAAVGEGNNVKGVPRLASFPHGEASWTQRNSYHQKFGMQTVISYEDSISNDLDVVVRSALRVARAITKSIDSYIFSVISDTLNTGSAGINTVTIPAGSEFDATTISLQDPIKYILQCKQAIAEQNYDPEGAFLCLSPKDYANILMNASVRNAGQFYTPSVTERGEVGTICGLRILVSNNVTADYALVAVGKECCTYKELVPLTTRTIEEPGIGITIRSFAIGVAQLKNPKSVCLLIGTQK